MLVFIGFISGFWICYAIRQYEMTENKQFYINNKTTQMIKASKDQLIQFMKYQGQRNIHCFIVDELPNISKAEVDAVYITVDSIADDSIAYCHYYTVIDDMWLTVDENLDMNKYMNTNK